MDILGHAIYGATLCSRSGLAGGRIGAPGRRQFDWTAWAAVAFSILPDMASIGLSFGQMLMHGDAPSFHDLPPYVFVLYRLTHSVIVAGLCVILLRAVARPLFVPALAWPVHILMDSVLHGDGRWQTPVFFPLSDWHLPGINWWEHPRVVLFYWALLPAIWLAIRLWRRRGPLAKS
jgi:hypothetical protein